MKDFLPWKIMHMAVREPLPDLGADARWGGLFLVFWCDSVPVGQASIPTSLLPLSSLQLAAMVPPLIAQVVGNRLMSTAFQAPLPVEARKQMPAAPPELARLLELERPLATCSRLAPSWKSAPAKSFQPSVSVVICTRNRPKALHKCLSSIRGLSLQPNEIVVVDNDPSSGVSQAVTAAFPEVRCVAEPRPGLSVARNTGVRHCGGAIIAFTDDDVMVHPGWTTALRSVFQDPGVMASTGLVLPTELATQAQYAFQASGLGWGYRVLDFDMNFFRSMKHIGVPAWRLGAGANMAFRREAFDRVGFFDERLGAGASGCSEDSELWYRLLAEGHRCRYEPAAVVFHAHRSDWTGLSDQTFYYMRGHVAALFFQFDRYKHWGNLYRAFLALPFYLLKLAYRSLKRALAGFIVDSGKNPPSLPLGKQLKGAIAGYGSSWRHRHLRAHDPPPAAARPGELTPSAGGGNRRV